MDGLLDTIAPLVDSDQFQGLDAVGKADFREKAFGLFLNQDPAKAATFERLPPAQQDFVRNQFVGQVNQRFPDAFSTSGYIYEDNAGLVTPVPTKVPILDPHTERFLASVAPQLTPDADGTQHVRNNPNMAGLVESLQKSDQPTKDQLSAIVRSRFGDEVPQDFGIPDSITVKGVPGPQMGNPDDRMDPHNWPKLIPALLRTGAALGAPAAADFLTDGAATPSDGALAAGGAAVAEPFVQYLEKNVFRTRAKYSLADAGLNVGLAAIPGAAVSKAAPLMTQVGAHAAAGAAIGVGQEGARELLDGGKLDAGAIAESGAIGAAMGGILGGTPAAYRWLQEGQAVRRELLARLEQYAKDNGFPGGSEDDLKTWYRSQAAKPAEPVTEAPAGAAPAAEAPPAAPASPPEAPQPPAEVPGRAPAEAPPAEVAPAAQPEASAPAPKPGTAPETVPDPITAAENRVLNGQGAERLLEVQQEAAKAGGSDQDYASALEKAASQPPPEKPAEDPAAAAKVALGPQYAHLVTGLEASGTDSHIAAGLEAAAPDLLTLRGTDLDLAEPLGRALSELPALRASGLPADKYLQQAQTTGDDPEQPEADLILGRLAHAKSPEDVSQFLRQYVASALQQKQADDARLAGAPENPDQGPVTPAGAAEADLSRSMSSVPSPDSTDRPEAGAPSAQSLGIIPSGRAAEMLSSIANGMKGLGHEITTVPHMDAFKTVLNDWHGERQMNTLRLRKIVSDLLRVVPNASAREGISNWLDAGGNMQTLKQWADATPSGSLKRGYEAALSLTPEQLETANNIRQYFVAKLAEGQREGIFPEFDSDGKPWEGIDNYISHIVRQPFVGGGAGSRFSGKLTRTFKFGGTRTFPNFHELEKAGLQAATKDVAEILATYSNEMDKTIQTRRLIKRLVQTKNEAGEALAQVLGGTITKDQGSAATFISPQFSQTRDDLAYRSLDHPALRNWRWVATDADGKPVMMLGELGLHPAIYPHLKNVLGRSAIREWYDQPGSTSNLALKATVKGLDNLNRTVANTMMGFISTFHPVHLAKRALIGNRINPFAFKQLDPADPMLQRAVKTGLALAGDNEAAQLFMDGFGAGSLTDKVPMIGALGRTYTNFIFHRYIPQLKFAAWLAMRDRNLKAYRMDIALKRTTEQDVEYLTSRQVNARFGHLNMVDLGRNPTMQHIARMATLAPDFWESNLRNYGEVAQGIASLPTQDRGKVGRQPLIAFLVTLGTVWLASRVLNELLDDDPHLDQPFSVVHSGRIYTMRNEAEDLWRLYKNWRQYVAGRLSPMLGSAIEVATGRNYRGEKVTLSDSFKDFLEKVVPISLRWLPGLQDLSATTRTSPISPIEEFLGSQGLQVSRHSPLNDAFSLAADFNRAHGVPESTGVYPVSKYQALRYALEDNNRAAAATAVSDLFRNDPALGPQNLIEGFKRSLFRPFTGDRDREAKFMASLAGNDLKTVRQATAERNAVWDRFTTLLATAANSTAPAR